MSLNSILKFLSPTHHAIAKHELCCLLISLAIVHYFVYVAPKTVNTLSIDADDCHDDIMVTAKSTNALSTL